MQDERPEIANLSPQEKRQLLARLIRERRSRSDSAFPLSYGQQALWYLQQVTPDSAAYNFMYAWWIRSEVDFEALRRAFQGLLDRHAVLRTTYGMQDGRPVQTVHPRAEVYFKEIDARAWTFEQLEQQLRNEAHRPFDLASGPVWRVHIFKRVPGEHLLAMTFHHIAIDFWCGPLLLDELRLRYQAARHGMPLELPPLRAEYSDFVRWQADMVAGPEGQRLLDYWRGRLAGAPPVLDLPTDRPRPRVYTYDGAVCDFHVEQRLTERLKAFARAEGTTLFTVLLATLQVWLHRHTGQEDIVVGSPTAGRVRPGFERIVGYFANPVVLRTDCGGNPAFRALCRQARGTVLGALEHQAYPFSRLVEVLHPDRDPSRSPLFDVLFTLQSMQRFAREGRLSRLGDRSGMSPFGASSLGSASTRMELGELVFESFPIEMTVAQFDLDIEMIDLHEGIAGKINYNANLFEAPTVARMARRFERLLEQFATDPDQPIGDAALLTDDEREQIVVQWNATPSDAPIEQCVHALFEAQVARAPDAPAVRYAGETLSYAELNARANRVACSLRASGIGPGRFVAIALEPDWRLPVAMLGVLKAGGAYLPLDCSYPAQRQRFMLDDAAPAMVLTAEALVDRLPADGPPRVCIDSILAAAETGAAGNLAPVAGPCDLAYVIYTSGSTGTPKGVLVEHRSVVNHNLAVIERFGLEKTDRVLQFASPSFDALVEELFPTWARGGAVVLRDGGGAPACEELLRLIDEHAITVLNLPTAYWQVWVDEMARGGYRLPASLRAVIVGGDKASRERFDTWRVIGGDRVRWINTYGPTETTIIVTSFEPTADWADATSGREIPIGRPLPNTRLYVLDVRQQPVPVGVPGELYVGGAPVARGYLHRPELTAERFVPDPFSSEPGARLYRTGDRVRYVDDGLIEFVGRVDAQVKIRGFRVEPGEIEAALLAHAAVREAFVLAREDVAGQTKRLVAYVARANGAAPTPADLRTFLQESLPAYMVPSVIVPVDALPRLASGKVDRNALPDPHAEGAESVTAAFVAPETPIEEALAGIWRDVLGVERVGVHDNFFELGGDSILSVQVVARANRAGLRLTARHMFQYQTVAELAGVVGTGRPIQAEQGPVTGDVPLTPVQCWFFEQDLAEPHHFNQAVLFELRQRFDPVRLRAAVHHLLIHHDALRLRFTRMEAGWQQRNAGLAESQAETVFSTIDLSGTVAAARRQAIETHATRLQTSLDVCEGPLLRVAWFDCGTGSDRLLMVIHHLAVDGVSWRILLEDLFTAYSQLEAQRPVELPAKTTSFREWAQRLGEHARSDAMEAESRYWLGLADGGAGTLPLDHETGPNDMASVETVRVTLDAKETHELLHEVPAAYRTRIDEVLLTAVVQAFGEWTGCPALSLDVEGHGREDLFDDVDLARTVGWFTTMFLVRFDLSDVAGPGEAIKHVKRRWRGVPRHGIGFGLLRYLRGDAELACRLATIRPQVRFNYLGQLDAGMQGSMPLAMAPESFGPLSGSRNARTHLLDINAGVTAGRLEVAWSFSRNRHTAATINRLSAAFVEALRAMIAHCRQPDVGGCTPSDFPLAALDQASLDRLVGNGRTIEDLYPLSPLQAGLLFHSRYAPDSAMYFSQFSCTLVGDFDPDAYHAAWQRIVDRHPILRTSFAWKALSEPLQLVHRHVPVAWTQHDWRDVPAAEQPARIDAFLEADRQRGFDLDKPPLTRLAVLRLADDAWHIVSTNHHLLLDGWSLPIMMTEVMATYEGLVRGQDVPLDPPRPYRDYIRWLQEQDFAEAEAFWRRMLEGFAAPTPLPAARPAGAVAAMASHNGQLSEAATATLEQWARRQQVTLNTLVQGAWAILLSRYSGEVDIAFGMTVSGRSAPLAAIETMPGVFINTLPVRVTVSANAGLLPWLRALQAQQAELRQFEHSPLAQVQRWSDVPAGLPLFESIIVFENYPVDQALRHRGASLAIRDVRRHLARTNYPLVLVVEPGKALQFEIAYDTARFDAATIERLFGHLRTLLEAMTADGEPCVASLPMLTPPEFRQLIDEWGHGAVAVAAPHDRVADASTACIHRRFEAQAARRPDAVALTYNGKCFSYRELNERANRLAHYLMAAGVGPETLVGICLERSLDMVVSILGVLKAGGAYVPLDPTYPADRLQFMVGDARMPVVVTLASLAERLSDRSTRCVCLDTEAEAIVACAKVDPSSDVAPDNAAYVIYTSGSTGKPKGVVVTHRNVMRLFDATEAWFGFGPEDVWTLFHSYAFDFSVWELWGALCYGGRLVVVPFAVSRSPEVFATLLRTEGVTVLNQTPSAFQSLLRVSDSLPAESALRFVIFGGEALDLQMLRPWFDRYGDARPQIINMYGITETTVHVTYRPITRADLDAGSGSVIGRPIPDLRTHILDTHGQPAPVGVPGELHVGGAGLARGYLNRPELTAERFIPDPFNRQGGERLYKTGDLCRYRPDGDMEYLGRIDDQVKIRGFRVELGEIETALEQRPNVREAVVLARAADSGEKRLVGYIVAGDEAPAISDLRQCLAERLPDYMVPSVFVFLDAIPRLPNGKIDRKALPAPDATRPELAVGYVAPRNDLEQTLAEAWSVVLGVERVGVMDDFFELGGDSIAAARLVYRLEEHLGEAVYPVALFESPNIAELARSLAASYPDTVAARFGADVAPVASEAASPAVPGFMTVAGLAAEAVLDPAIRPEAASRDGELATVLLTGATGFLGAFLLAEWLEQTTAEVHCLVRAADDDAAAARVQRSLESYGIWNDAFRSRIVPVAGDLSKPLLGLSVDRFDAFAKTLDAIVHNGALVNFLQPYAALKAPNVLGTQEVLRLACRYHAKPVHYVSTNSVFATQELAGCIVHEADSPDDITGLRGGYAQSKWVAEKLVAMGQARGLPVAIYRPGRISGHSRTGVSNPDDMMLQLLLGCIRIGAAPDFDMEDDMAPVDYIARAIVYLACRSTSCGKAFHLVNPCPVRWADLLEGLGACGYPVNCVSLEQWLDAWGDGQAPEHRAFQQMARAYVGADLPRLPRFDCRNTLDGLRGTTISCPPVDAALLKTYLAYWQGAGLLEPPTVSA